MNKSMLIALTITASFTLLLFTSPLMIKKRSVRGLNGVSNNVEYGEIWERLPLLPRTTYYFGDFFCHQKYSRSLVINGNQMPMCARCTSIFIGMSIGFGLALFIEPKKDLFETGMQFIPSRLRTKERKKPLLIMIGIVFILPIAVDGLLQLFTSYHSSNLLRVITGTLAGIGFACVIGGSILNLLKIRDDKNN